MDNKIDYAKPEYYCNRELSWVAFNKRVLGEANDKNIPLFERLKFLSITASNLDEFFMVRVASLKDMVNAGYTKPDISGMTPTEQLEALNDETHRLVEKQYETYNNMLLPLLAKNGLRVIERHEELTKADCEYVDMYFQDNVYPVLTPMAVDSSRPFPLIRNKSLNLGALVSRKDSKTKKHLFNKKSVQGKDIEFATVQVPSVIPRIVQLPGDAGGVKRVILL
jgi:polyphosphate kinase